MKKSSQNMYGKLCSQYYDIRKKYASNLEIDLYTRFMLPHQRVLEAMSGSGRLQIPLLKRGYIVDGVDSSPIMLERCKNRCLEFNLNPKLYEQQLENMELPYTYQTIIIAIGSFQLIPDKTLALIALKKMHDHLYENGDLLIDIFIPDSFSSGKQATFIEYIDNHQAIQCDALYTFYQKEQKVDVFCTYSLIVSGTIQKREKEVMHFIWYSDTEFTELLHSAGFNRLETYELTLPVTGLSRIVHAKKINTISKL